MAPGKLVLAGEYGVLTGSPALVAAVDRFVVMRPNDAEPTGADAGMSHREQNTDPLLAALLEEASRHTELPSTLPVFDVEELHDGKGNKLGLGSSAAKAAALMCGAFLLAGEDPGRLECRNGILESAWRAHRLAGGGSGADVAASVLGGTTRFRLDLRGADSVFGAAEADVSYQVEQVTLPAGRMPIVVHGGSPISTRAALANLETALKQGNAAVSSLLRRLADAGESLGGELLSKTARDGEILGAVKRSCEALAELAAALRLDAGAGREALEKAREISEGRGGAVKPSGAGGGDLLLVFLPSSSPGDRRHMAVNLYRAGLGVLDVGLHEGGVRPSRPS